MPWKETCAVKERLQLVTLYHTGKYTVSELARQFRVSRRTAHKWLSRYRQMGISGLDEWSRAPHTQAHATPPAVVAALLDAKLAHPTWGPAKLLATGQAPEIAQDWPAVSTRGRILRQHGLVSRRKHRRRVSPWFQPFLGTDTPNAVWCADFKGYFLTADGARCDPLTVTDAYSRMLLGCENTRPDGRHVRPVFERLFREYGLPRAIRTDNGTPFASTGAGGLSPLSVWWVKLGILPERIRPAHPEQNGRHERMHRTLKQDTARPPAESREAQQTRFDRFRAEYNTLRPHEALGQIPPSALYTPSPRTYPERLGDIEYPPLTEVRRVRSNGQVKWHGTRVFISESLVGELIGITEDTDGWLVSFGPIALGLLVPGHASLVRLPPTYINEQSSKGVTYVLS